jgi:hypothetical protein
MRTCSYSLCRQLYEPKTTRQRFCRAQCRDRKLGRERRVKRGTAVERGYGKAHYRERDRWRPIVDSGDAVCCRCSRPIGAGAPFHLDHDDEDRTRYRGVAHPSCNVRAGAIKGNRERTPTGPTYTSRPRIS